MTDIRRPSRLTLEDWDTFREMFLKWAHKITPIDFLLSKRDVVFEEMALEVWNLANDSWKDGADFYGADF